MQKVKVLRISAAVVSSLSLTGGLVGVVGASSASIGTTGPNSHQDVEFRNSQRTEVRNNNTARVSNSNPQYASSGDASVHYNTTGGSASTGDAKNDSLQSVSATVNNSSSASSLPCGCDSNDTADIDNTGPGSRQNITFANRSTTEVTNNNNLSVNNSNHQTAKTGDAKVSYNTTGGNATSGDAENIGTQTTTVSFTN